MVWFVCSVSVPSFRLRQLGINPLCFLGSSTNLSCFSSWVSTSSALADQVSKNLLCFGGTRTNLICTSESSTNFLCFSGSRNNLLCFPGQLLISPGSWASTSSASAGRISIFSVPVGWAPIQRNRSRRSSVLPGFVGPLQCFASWRWD